MENHGDALARFSHFLHRNFIWFLMSSYLLAALAPRGGLAIKNVSLGRFHLFGEHVHISLPMLLLALLLLNAGLGVQTERLRHLLWRPWSLIAGLAANLFIPIAYIYVVSLTMRRWHNPEEVQHILVGLAVVAAMPIAGSSTAWTQNANGDLSLSLGLVLFSTLLSPLTTPTWSNIWRRENIAMFLKIWRRRAADHSWPSASSSLRSWACSYDRCSARRESRRPNRR
jgi:BASS family bile acid:Na+ symporter